MPSSTAWVAAALLGASASSVDASASYAGIIKRDEHDSAAEGRFPPPTDMPHGDLLPAAFSWRDVPGVGSLLTVGGNQHIPHYCGACYAFGSMHTLQDRVKIARFLMDKEWRLNPANAQTHKEQMRRDLLASSDKYNEGSVREDERGKGEREDERRNIKEDKTSGDSHAPLRDPDLIASVQVLLNCFNDKACHGGSTASAWNWAKNFGGGGVPVLGCMSYAAEEGRTCDAVNTCQNCMGVADYTDENPKYECWAVPADKPLAKGCFGVGNTCMVQPYPRLGVADHGKVGRSEHAIMTEIASRGPVACAIDAMPLLGFDTSLTAFGHDAVVQDTPELAAAKVAARKAAAKTGKDHVRNHLDSKNLTDHIIEVVGWGVDADSGTPYWEIRNSWGEYWADGGFAKVRRGRNDLNIESDCDWVVPSGWGVPGQGKKGANDARWQAYDHATVDRAAVKLLASVAAAASASAFASAGTHGRAPVEAGAGPAPAASAPSLSGLGALGLAACAAFVAVFVRQLGSKDPSPASGLPSSSFAAASTKAAPTVTFPSAEMRNLVTPRRGQYQQI